MTSTLAPSPPAPSAPGRHITARRSLPSGRAMLGALLVTLAVVAVFVAAGGTDAAPSTTHVVAVRAIERGATVTASDLGVEAIELPDPVAANAFASVDELLGAVAMSPIEAGELVQRGHVARAFDGVEGPSLEFSFPIARSRSPRTLRPGDAVAVLATTGSGDAAITEVVVAAATVIAFDADDSGPASRTSAVLTVAITDAREQLAVAHAAQVAELTVIRTTKGADTPLPARYPETTP